MQGLRTEHSHDRNSPLSLGSSTRHSPRNCREEDWLALRKTQVAYRGHCHPFPLLSGHDGIDKAAGEAVTAKNPRQPKGKDCKATGDPIADKEWKVGIFRQKMIADDLEGKEGALGRERAW